MGQAKELLYVGALAQGFVHLELSLAAGLTQHQQQFFESALVEVLGKPQTGAADLQRTNGLLQGFLVGLADAHDLADGPHLRAEVIDGPLEFLEGPARELDDHVIPAGGVLLQRAVAPIGDFVKRQARGQLGRDTGDGGNAVALLARALDRLVRGLISMMTTRPVRGSWANWMLVPPMTWMASTTS